MLSKLLILAGLAAVWPAIGHCQPITVEGSDRTQTVDCAGNRVVVRGDRNTLTLGGRCPSLLLEGNENHLRAELATGALLEVRGNGNVVRYTVPDGGDARVRVAGNGDTVQSANGAAGAPASRAPMALREESAHRSVDCTDRDVTIEGNDDEYVLTGGCRSLTLRGERVRVQAQMQPASPIRVQGNADTIAWSLIRGGANPIVSVDGENSQVMRGNGVPPPPVLAAAPPMEPPPAAPVPPGELVSPHVSDQAKTPPAHSPVVPARPAPAPIPALPVHAGQGGIFTITGDHEARDIDCDGRSIRIDGSYELIVLRGACAAVIVKGDSNKVQAEVRPGAKIQLDGANSTVAYVVNGEGADAVVTLNGHGNRALRIARLGDLTPIGTHDGDAAAKHDAEPAGMKP